MATRAIVAKLNDLALIDPDTSVFIFVFPFLPAPHAPERFVVCNERSSERGVQSLLGKCLAKVAENFAVPVIALHPALLAPGH